MSASDQAGPPINDPPLRPETAAGYGQPPIGTRFKKGQSGNPKGRPRGRRNVANVMLDLLNKPVTVRESKKTRKMPAAEVAIRMLANKAGQGDGRALSTVIDLMEKTGRTNEITDEEREKRTLRMRRPYTREETDL